MFKRTLFASLLLWNLSHAALEDHFKKAGEKLGTHTMRNIDFIYVINLDQRPEKFAHTVKVLGKYGITPFRFSAVNGWELSMEAIDGIGLKYQPGMTPLMATAFPAEAKGAPSHEFMTDYGKTYFCHGMVRGTIGCALSHLSVLKDAWDSGYETIWVLEDDIQLDKDPHLLSDYIDQLDRLVGKNNWDVLFTDPDTKNSEGKYVPCYGASKRPDMDCTERVRFDQKYKIKTRISKELRKVGARFGTYSMIIRRSGIKKLLEFAYAHKIYLPHDLDNYLHPDIRRFCTIVDVVSPMIDAPSDNGVPNYEQDQ